MSEGLTKKIKRSLVFDYLKKYAPHICILQETHLVDGRRMGLKRPWMGRHYHATHSNYAQGVSVLVHKSLNFEPLNVVTDPEGRYVLIHARIDMIEMVLAGLYLPPPANISLLHKLTSLIAQFHTDNVILAGDFNIPPNPSLDKLSPDSATDSALSRWAGVFELEDVWRCKHPTNRMYTCNSSSCKHYPVLIYYTPV